MIDDAGKLAEDGMLSDTLGWGSLVWDDMQFQELVGLSRFGGVQCLQIILSWIIHRDICVQVSQVP